MDNIRDIAYQVRTGLKPLISKHSVSFAPDYGCACAVSSYLLTKILNDLGYNAKFVIGEFIDRWNRNNDHAFVVLDDYIVDITASQFGKESVYIVPADSKEYIIISSDKKAFEDLRNWPADQQPKTYSKFLKKVRNSVREQFMERAA